MNPIYYPSASHITLINVLECAVVIDYIVLQEKYVDSFTISCPLFSRGLEIGERTSTNALVWNAGRDVLLNVF